MGRADVKTSIHDGQSFQTFSPTGDPLLDTMYGGLKLAPDANGEYWLSYSFPGQNSRWSSVNSYYTSLDQVKDKEGDAALYGTEHLRGMEPLSPEQQQQFESVLSDLEHLTNLRFVKVADVGNFSGTARVAFTETPIVDGGWAYPPGENPINGDFWLYKGDGYETKDITSLARHEFSHTLGLKDSFYAFNGFSKVADQYDGNDYTIMAYDPSARLSSTDGYSGSDLPAQSFMYLDILALQHLYGVNGTSSAGDDTYSCSQQDRHHLTLWDTGGTDTLNVSDGDKDVKLDLRPGNWSDVGTVITYYKDYRDPESEALGTETETVFIMPGTIIENAVAGDGHDRVIGNEAPNRLEGGAGDDVLSGGMASDTLIGGAGNDVIWAGAGDDSADLMQGGDGDDVIGGGAGGDTLDGGTGADKLWAGAGDDDISAGAGDDVIGGGTGSDVIHAGGGSDTVFAGKTGDDTIQGGGGADIIFASSGDDDVSAGEGADLVYGGDGQDRLDGQEGDDSVYGGQGDDTITAGAGDDFLIGGAGADHFYFNDNVGNNRVLDFSLAEDTLHLGGNSNFENGTRADVIAASTEATLEGLGGVLIDLGGGNSVFLLGLELSDLNSINLMLGEE